MTSDAAEPPAEAIERKFLGATLGDLTKQGLTLVVGILGGLSVAWWTSKEPHLTVGMNEPIRFQGEKNQPGIINFTVASDGTKEAETIECLLNLGTAKIQEVKLTPSALKAQHTVKDGVVTVTAALLNPRETLQVSVLVNDAGGLPEKVAVSVRGKGVVGDYKAYEQATLSKTTLNIILFVVFVYLLTSVYTFYLLRRFLNRNKDFLAALGDRIKKITD